jgi:hypothetical protein
MSSIKRKLESQSVPGIIAVTQRSELADAVEAVRQGREADAARAAAAYCAQRGLADVAQMRAFIAQLRRPDPLAWARRVVRRHERGYPVAPLALERSRAALVAAARQRGDREPGEEG